MKATLLEGLKATKHGTYYTVGEINWTFLVW